ncbi:MAG: class I SAM-dependent methyltransferase [Saprospiraceae bacterium]|nr:class I SAM-dependent methyltransferase [Saprospiraceae bacterium]
MEYKEDHNEERWDALARKGVLCSQPKLELTPDQAKDYVNRNHRYGESLAGKNVLCLASGGGQQSIGFALLGARVTVVDFSEKQLEKDKLVAEKYAKEIRLVKADMRNLSFLNNEEFHIVYQPYSLNYVSSVGQVFDEVVRVLKPEGVYDLMFHNPYAHGTWKDGCWGSQWTVDELWEGRGYPVWQPYQDGYPIKTSDPAWNFIDEEGKYVSVDSPQEYRHTMSTIINGLINRGLEMISYAEEAGNDFDSEPGTWEHYKSCLPPWIYILWRKKKINRPF